jgi:hypothetical protein
MGNGPILAAGRVSRGLQAIPGGFFGSRGSMAYTLRFHPPFTASQALEEGSCRIGFRPVSIRFTSLNPR